MGFIISCHSNQVIPRNSLPTLQRKLLERFSKSYNLCSSPCAFWRKYWGINLVNDVINAYFSSFSMRLQNRNTEIILFETQDQVALNTFHYKGFLNTGSGSIQCVPLKISSIFQPLPR